MLAIASSLLAMSFPSTKVIFEELGPFSLKNGVILFQKKLLSETRLMFKLLKYSFLVFRKIF